MDKAEPQSLVAVVIPYFRRDAGILRRALSSVIAQVDCALPRHVIIVDDSSQAPAELEIASLDWAAQRFSRSDKRTLVPVPREIQYSRVLPQNARFVAFLD